MSEFKDVKGVGVSIGDEVAVDFSQVPTPEENQYFEDLRNIERVGFKPENGSGKGVEIKMLAIGEVIEHIGNAVIPLVKVQFRKGEVKSVYSNHLEVMP